MPVSILTLNLLPDEVCISEKLLNLIPLSPQNQWVLLFPLTLFTHLSFLFVVSLDNGRQRWDEKRNNGIKKSSWSNREKWDCLERRMNNPKKMMNLLEGKAINPKTKEFSLRSLRRMRDRVDERGRRKGLRAIFCNHRVFYGIQSLEKEGKLNDFERWTSPTVTVFLTHE